ncbi:uncharacterized protein Bfra_009730sa [Botrytis fragariae]|uniref:Uncharacterized protein n=1 Tax=Botrytis fragariae TaxID=1964551 RepID=A0A8H6EFJ9_9HELO|nr:uncharacterized protein Bfra_009730sa [Botrytis fragariae]KAF5870346.1 hypothetical protein Bfra_009730sa [Botrytis fragariae]
MPKTRRQEAEAKSGVSKSTRSGAGLADDASSADFLNKIHRPPPKVDMKVARKYAPSTRQARQSVQVAPESDEDVEDALNKQLNENNEDPSGLEPEDMTKELENAQPASPAEKKKRGRPRKEQITKEKEKGGAQDVSQLQNASPQKRKRDDARIYDFAFGEDEQDIRPARSRRASKSLSVKGAPKPRQYSVKPKKGRGQPDKSLVDESGDFDEDFLVVADIENGNSTVDQGPGQPDVGAPFNDRRASVRRTRDDDGEHVDDGENQGDEDDGGDGITEIAMPLTPAEPQGQISREQHKQSANIARTISSNHANGFHSKKIQSSRYVRGREEQVGEDEEGDGEPGAVANDVGEKPNVATAANVPEQREAAGEEVDDESDDEEESYQKISEQLVAWTGIITRTFFPDIEKISKRFGCRETRGTWIPVVLEKHGLATISGKNMERYLKMLQQLYQALKLAINEENNAKQIEANSHIDQIMDLLDKRIDNKLKPLEKDAPKPDVRKRRRYLEDIYIVLIREFLRLLRTAILTYGNLHVLSIEALSTVIRITSVILKLFDILDKQTKDSQPEDCGQTKQPMKELRIPLRNVLLQGCQMKLAELHREEAIKKHFALTQESRRVREEEDARLETERMEQERKIREFNSSQQKTIMASPKKASLIELEMERIAYRKLPQAERIRLELEAENKKRSRRPVQQIPQVERERSAASSQRSQSSSDDRNDPFSDNYDPPRGANRKPVSAQSRREAKFSDIPDDEKQRFYDHFKEKYRYEEERGLKDEEFWGRLQKDLHGGRYTLDEIWGFAKELQASLDFAHDEGEFHGEEHFWTFYVWDWDMES